MSKPSILSTPSFTVFFLVLFSCSQAQTLTDPGMSEHNYKMPNKAAYVKSRNQGQHFVAAMKPAFSSAVQQTTKYAVRPSSIVFSVDRKKESMNINPLSSVANYKTQSVSKMQSATEEYSAFID
jgi:hypothetical protein